VKTAAESFVWTESDRRREERARIEAERRAGELRVEVQKTADLILTAGEDCVDAEALTNEERQLVINNRDRLVQALQNYDRLLEKTLSPFRRSDLSSVMSNALWAVTVLSRFSHRSTRSDAESSIIARRTPDECGRKSRKRSRLWAQLWRSLAKQK
jgi:hypothetical protein